MERKPSNKTRIYSYQTKRHGKRWGAIWTGGRDYETGKPLRKRKHSFLTQTAAAEWLHEMDSRYRTGGVIVESNKPLGTWLTEWLEMRAHEVRPATLMAYRQWFNWYEPIYPILLKNLTPSDIERCAADLITKRKIKPANVANAQGMLTSALKTAVRNGLITRNPGEIARRPSAERPPRAALTIDQVGALLAATRDDGLWHVYWRLMLETYLRIGESLELRWSDVDLDAGTIAISRSQTRTVEGRLIVGEPKNRQSRRTIPISDEVVSLLKRHRAEQMSRYLRLGSRWHGNCLVFSTRGDHWLHRENVSDQLTEACSKAGIPRITPHQLRHTGGSLALLAGTDHKTVSERLGHANATITLKVYAHTNPEQHKRVGDLMGSLLTAAQEAV